MKKLLIFATLLLFLGACSQQEDMTPDSPQLAESDPFTGTAHDIYVNILTNRFGGYNKNKPKTRAEATFSLTPYVEEGDTLMYIVQYEKGWELYSASKATNMLIFSSDEGIFDMNDKNMPDGLRTLIKMNCERIKEAQLYLSTKIDNSWTMETSKSNLNQGTAKVKKNGIEKTVAVSDLPPGYWRLVKTELISENITYSPRLIKTFWDQETPWNTYSKYLINKNGVKELALAGCSVIAVGQYLYYTHYKDNVPSSTVTTAISSSNGMDFDFSGNSTTVWDEMPTYTSSTSISKPAAIFIGYIGRQLNANYTLDGTEVSIPAELQFLKNVFGVNFTTSAVNKNYIINSIDKGYPVLSHAETNKLENGTPIDKDGHLFLIDGYKKITKEYMYYYVYEREPWNGDGPDPWDDDERDENGNIIDYSIKKEESQYQSTYAIYMNWGWGKYYGNNVAYWPEADEWLAGYNFNLNHLIYKRDDIK